MAMRYSVKAAAMATGISESRLRTWERRYGIPRPARSATGRRLYDESDLAIIRRMAGLVSAGVSAREAADAARSEEAALTPTAVPAPTKEHPLVAPLVEASLAYDEPSITRIVREAVDVSWDKALEEILFPVLNRIGEYWGEGAVSCATEHFTSEVIRRELAAALAAVPDPTPDAPSVLLACAEEERHELGLLAMALLLSMRGLKILYLGADVPAPDLLYAIGKTEPSAVCLSATTASGLASLGRTARSLVSGRAPVRLFVGGSAFGRGNGDHAIPGVRLPHSLREAANSIAGAVSVRNG
jgi:DNA-binding transcriptional MerR regulator